MSSAGYGLGLPGFTALRETVERDVNWGKIQQHLYRSVVISSAAVDATNTPTTILRPGLVMAELDSGGEWVAYDPDATDGSNVAKGVLFQEVNTLDPVAAAGADRYCTVLVGGPIKGGTLIGLDYQARSQMSNLFRFDDHLAGDRYWGFSRVIQKAADYTVTVADNGALLVATAAAVFTLPTIEVGLKYTFLQSADANMTIASAGSSDNIIGLNDATADSIAFSTMSEKIGGSLEVSSIYIGANLRWYARNVSAGANTATVA